MKTENVLGMWREHSGGEFPYLSTSPRQVLEAQKLKLVLNYLKNGPIWIVSPGLVYSSISPGVVAGSSGVRTDGLWAWHDTLAHYVEVQQVQLPAEFIARICEADGVPPSEESIDLESLELPKI